MLTIQEWCVYNTAVDNHVTALGVLAIQKWCVGNTGMRDRLAETGKLAMRKLCVGNTDWCAGNTDWCAGNTEKVALCVFFGVCIHSIDMNTSIYYVW